MKKSIVAVLMFCGFAGLAFAQSQAPSGVMRRGDISLTRSSSAFSFPPFGALESTTDSFDGFFSMIDYGEPLDPSVFNVITIGQCEVIPAGNSGTIKPVTVTMLDAGPALGLTGPLGRNEIPIGEFGYSASLGGGTAFPFPGLPPPPPLFFEPGGYTVDNGAGGADVGPFVAMVNVASAFSWTNADAAISIDRTTGVDVTWLGGDPDSKVTIIGGVTLRNTDTGELSGAFFNCTEVNSAGHFFVPPEVLMMLPASGGEAGSLIVTNGVSVPFDAPGVDQSQITFSSSVMRLPQYQ